MLRISRRLLRILWWLIKAAGVALTVIGLAGLSDDLAAWSRWIDAAMYDPRVTELAEHAVAIANFVNQWWVRGLFFVGGISILLWTWRPVWRLRHRVSFRWRRFLADQVWISQEDALKLIKDSSWARLKEPNVVRSVSVLDSFSQAFMRERAVYGLTDVEKAKLKFDAFLDKVLDSFSEANPSACRTESGSRQIEETALRAFLRRAIDDEIWDEFGEVPSYKVT